MPKRRGGLANAAAHLIHEQSATATEQTASSSAELARLGVELQGLVGQFRT